MTDAIAPTPPTLEDVRARFLAAEDHLAQASRTLDQLHSAIESLDLAGDGLRTAGAEMERVRGALTQSVAHLEQNATALREGVELLRQAEPARVLREVGDLRESVAAGLEQLANDVQATRGQQLEHHEKHEASISQAGRSTTSAIEAARAALETVLNRKLESVEATLRGMEEAHDRALALAQRERAAARRETRWLWVITALLLASTIALTLLRAPQSSGTRTIPNRESTGQRR